MNCTDECRKIYVDNAATTKMSKTAINAMLPYMDGVYGNPSSLHSVGQKANEALVSARERIAKCLGCTAREITFTSGGSEADNQAIISAAKLGEKKGKKHIVVIAPAMNTAMYENPVTQRNIKMLSELGFQFIEPREARLACGDLGKGALAEVDVIVSGVLALLGE